MDSICIKNVGPIKDTGSMLLKEITVILGDDQGARRLLLRIIYFMRWFEEMVCIDSPDVYGVKTSGEEFKEALCVRFGVPECVFGDDSEIHYEGEFIHMSWVQGSNVNTYVKTWKKGYAPFVAILPYKRYLNRTQVHNTSIEDVPHVFDIAWRVLLDYKLRFFLDVLCSRISYCKDSDGFFFMDDMEEKEGNATRSTPEEFTTTLTGRILQLALYCISNVGCIKQLPPFDISTCKSIIEELSDDTVYKQEPMYIGCSHLCVEEVDSLMSNKKQIQYMMYALIRVMMTGCDKYRMDNLESSIVMTADSFEVYISLVLLTDEKKWRWRKRHIVCYNLREDGSLDGPMELY